jgi:hypothetical protein
MPIRIALAACVLVLGSLGAVTAAHAGGPYGGFGPDAGSETQPVVTAPDTEAALPEGDQTLPWLRPESQPQQDTYGNDGTQQGTADQGYDMDDEGGH